MGLGPILRRQNVSKHGLKLERLMRLLRSRKGHSQSWKKIAEKLMKHALPCVIPVFFSNPYVKG